MTYRALIIPAAHAPLARALAAGLTSAGVGMWTALLRPIGSTGEATHYVSAGEISDEFAALLDDPAALHAACVKAGAQVTRAQIDALLDAAVVSDGYTFTEGEIIEKVAEGPHELFARLGLELRAPTNKISQS